LAGPSPAAFFSLPSSSLPEAFGVAAGAGSDAAVAAAARSRDTGSSGKGFRLSASTAWAVTHTGVCELARE
jgi:hypothetical protein